MSNAQLSLSEQSTTTQPLPVHVTDPPVDPATQAWAHVESVAVPSHELTGNITRLDVPLRSGSDPSQNVVIAAQLDV